MAIDAQALRPDTEPVASDDGGDGGEALPAVHICRFFLTMLGFHPLWVERSFGDRYMTRAREIAAIGQAQIR